MRKEAILKRMEKGQDLTKVLTKAHEKKWVALTRDYKQVVAYDENLAELDRQVGAKDVVFMKVPSSDVFLSF